MKIPKIIHFIWAGGVQLSPDDYIESVIRWQLANPDFDIYFWVDAKSSNQNLKKPYKDKIIYLAGEVQLELKSSNKFNLDKIFFKDIEELYEEEYGIEIKQTPLKPSIVQEAKKDEKHIALTTPGLSESKETYKKNTQNNLSNSMVVFQNIDVLRKRVSLFEFSGFRPNSQAVDEKAALLLKEHLANTGRSLGSAYSEGDCFFDGVAQELINSNITVPFPDAKTSSQPTHKNLRQLCGKIVKNLEKEGGENWIKKAIEADNASYQDYLATIQFTAPEMDAHKEQKIFSGIAIWGRPHIEGRMLCQLLGIQLHIIEVFTQNNIVLLSHQLIDGQSSHQIDAQAALQTYANNKTIHLAVYQGSLHFAPLCQPVDLLPRLEADVKENLVDSERSGYSTRFSNNEFLTGTQEKIAIHNWMRLSVFTSFARANRQAGKNMICSVLPLLKTVTAFAASPWKAANAIIRYEIERLRPNYGASSDLLRYRILHKFGGAYFDFDISPGKKSLQDSMLFDQDEKSHRLYVDSNSQNSGQIGNDAFICTANNPHMRFIYELAEHSYLTHVPDIAENLQAIAGKLKIKYKSGNQANGQTEYREYTLSDPISDACKYDTAAHIEHSTIYKTGPGCVRAVLEYSPLNVEHEGTIVRAFPTGKPEDEIVIPFDHNGKQWCKKKPVTLYRGNIEQAVAQAIPSLLFEMNYLGYFRLDAHIADITISAQMSVQECYKHLLAKLNAQNIDYKFVQVAPLTYQYPETIKFYKEKDLLCKTGLFPWFDFTREFSAPVIQVLSLNQLAVFLQSKNDAAGNIADEKAAVAGLDVSKKAIITQLIANGVSFMQDVLALSLRAEMQNTPKNNKIISQYIELILQGVVLYKKFDFLNIDLKSQLSLVKKQLNKWQVTLKSVGQSGDDSAACCPTCRIA